MPIFRTPFVLVSVLPFESAVKPLKSLDYTFIFPTVFSLSIFLFWLVLVLEISGPNFAFLSFSMAIHIYYTVEVFVVALQLIFAFNSSFMCIENVNLSRFYAIRFLDAFWSHIHMGACVCTFCVWKYIFSWSGLSCSSCAISAAKKHSNAHSFPATFRVFIRFVVVRLLCTEFAHHISVTRSFLCLSCSFSFCSFN